MVDDDPELLAVAREALESAGMRVVTLADPLRFWSVLEVTVPDLVVLDIELPGVDGLELCHVLRQDQRHARLPVLFLSGHRRPEMIQAVFESGGDDFVSKPIIVPELLARIRNRLERMQLYARLADTDPLTRLANRRAFERRVTRLRALADRHGPPLAVALLDLDRFRTVNDRHGHTAGDAVLVGLAGILEDAFRGEDVVGRWGGEELVVAMYGMARPDGVRRVREVADRLAATSFPDPAGGSFRVTLSAGVAQYPVDAGDLQGLYRIADEALLAAKAGGRDRVLPARDR